MRVNAAAMSSTSRSEVAEESGSEIVRSPTNDALGKSESTNPNCLPVIRLLVNWNVVDADADVLRIERSDDRLPV